MTKIDYSFLPGNQESRDDNNFINKKNSQDSARNTKVRTLSKKVQYEGF